MLSALFGLSKFHQYTYGRDVKVVTDGERAEFVGAGHEGECAFQSHGHQIVLEETTRPDFLASDVYRHTLTCSLQNRW